MKKLSMACRAVPLALLFTGGLAQAQDVPIVFKANIVETTCTMKVTGGTGDGQNNTLKIGVGGKVGLDKLIAGDQVTTTAAFSLDIVECPGSLQKLKTSVNGSVSEIPTGIKNNIAQGDGGAQFIGVSIARTSAPDKPFKINSTTDAERLVWTETEIKQDKKVNLTARLTETQANMATTGQFSALATFAFTYE
ncbi:MULTISPECIES: fimbrial protein [Yersiniaceae]|uniref:Fimbrial protein n=1 Tax=Nissabacter archeti TaxID=1917880 RepID=A0ABS5JEX7_9GAMM|nr:MULTISPECIES: fimbrial protein [Yersiniaceae]MBS0968419.1 fimbrial protein [Nissabacter archeti]MDV5139618.1 fimbrial protein [Chimaeribacter arupi]PLR38203.1 fimbrial protein [Chimaeribacter arupi]